MNKKSIFALVALASFASFASSAQAADGLDTLNFALLGGTPNVDLRARWEFVDNQSPANKDDASAATLRTRLGYTTGKWNAIDLNVEFENISALNPSAYNSTLNGKTTRPVIPDPTGSELNQFWIRYTGIANTVAQLGRNRLILDNQRFIGNVGWRQNEQTYDGLVVTNKSVKDLEITTSYLSNVNNFFGTNVALKGYVANAGYQLIPTVKLTGYYSDFDFTKNSFGRSDTRTIGLRAAGAVPINPDYKLTYTAEYAQQEGTNDAVDAVEANYILAELGVSHKIVQAKLGYEVLGSNDGAYGLQTPLATLHAHNGWADIFLQTPIKGLQDTYAQVTGTAYKVALTGAYHRYQSDVGSENYGDEINFFANYPVNKQINIGFKYAYYNAVKLAMANAVSAGAKVSDTEKFWLQTEFKF